MKKIITFILMFVSLSFSLTAQFKSKSNLVIDPKAGNMIYSYHIQSRTMAGHKVSVNLNYSNNIMTSCLNSPVSDGTHSSWSQLKRTQAGWILGVNGFALQVLGQKYSFSAWKELDLLSNKNDPNHPYYSILTMPKFEDEHHTVWLVDGYDYCNRMHPLTDDTDKDIIKLLRADGSVMELVNPVTLSDAGSDIDDATLYTGNYYEKGMNTTGYAYVEFVPETELSNLEKETLNNQLTGERTYPFGKKVPIENKYPNTRRPRIIHYYPGDGLEYIFREDIYPYGTRQNDIGNLVGGDILNMGFTPPSGGETSIWVDYAASLSLEYRDHFDFSPTIFYLESIGTAEKRIVDISWVNEDQVKSKTESHVFRGRRPVESFADVTLYASDHADFPFDEGGVYNTSGFYTIETIGKTLYLPYSCKFNLLGTYRDDPEDYFAGTWPWKQLTNNQNSYTNGKLVSKNNAALNYNKFIKDIGNIINQTDISNPDVEKDIRYEDYYSVAEQHFINSIYEGENRVIKFDYKFDSLYYSSDILGPNKKGFSFPFKFYPPEYLRNNQGINGLRRVRLETISEPTIKYEIEYKYGDNRVDLDSLEIVGNYDVNTVVSKLTTSAILKGQATKVAEKEFDFISGPISLDVITSSNGLSELFNSLPSTISTSVFDRASVTKYTVFEKNSNASKSTSTTITGYKKLSIDAPSPSSDLLEDQEQYRTYLPTWSAIKNNDVVKCSYTFYDENKYPFLPKSTSEYLFLDRDGANLLRNTSYVTMNYTFENVVKFDEPVNSPANFSCDKINNMHGDKVETMTVNVYNPDNHNEILYSNTTEFLNLLPPASLANDYEISIQNRPATYNSNLKNVINKNTSDPLVISKTEVVQKSNAPCYFGLPIKQFTKKGSKVLSGVQYVYNRSLNGYSSGLPYGCLTEVYRMSESQDEATAISNKFKVATYDYWTKSDIAYDLAYGNIKSITNSQGAKTSFLYDKRYENSNQIDDVNLPDDMLVMYHNEKVTKRSNYSRFIDYQLPVANIARVRSNTSDFNLVSQNIFDKFGNVVGSTNLNNWVTSAKYDELGRLGKVTQPYDYPYGVSFDDLNINPKECVELVDPQTQVEVKKDKWLLYEEEIARRMEEAKDASVDQKMVAFNTYPRFNYMDVTPKSSGEVLNLKSLAEISYFPWEDDILHSSSSISSAQLKINCLFKGVNHSNILELNIPQLSFKQQIVVRSPELRNLVSKCGNNLIKFDDPTPAEVRFDLTKVVNDIIKYGKPIDFQISTPTHDANIEILTKSEESKPCLEVKAIKGHGANDFTYAYKYFDNSQEIKVISKIDDTQHESHYFGSDFSQNLNGYDLNDRSNDYIGRYTASITKNIDIYDSKNYLLTDPKQNSSNIFTTTERDALGRVINSIDMLGNGTSMDYQYATELDQDGYFSTSIDLPGSDITSITKRVKYLTPSEFSQAACPDISNKFYGLVKIVESEQEGKVRKIFNALGQLLCTIQYGEISSDKKKITYYRYDDNARLVRIDKPSDTDNTKGGFSKIWYDDLGRVSSKFSKEKGFVSLVYNSLNQVRFSQDEKQAQENKLSYKQYDDLGRTTIIGEAKLNNNALAYNTISNPESVSLANIKTARGVLSLDAEKLHISGYNSTTVNPTLYKGSGNQKNMDEYIYDEIANMNLTASSAYSDSPNSDVDLQNLNFIQTSLLTSHAVGSTAPVNNFEDIEDYPHFVRKVFAYDNYPEQRGKIWGNMPDYDYFFKILQGIDPNLKGNVAAIAYRDSEEDEFSYVVMRYDARDRVKAFVRYTNSNSIDAVYYNYNSANQVTSVFAFDALNTYCTWYGYNELGQLHKVWSKMIKADDPNVGFSGFFSDYRQGWNGQEYFSLLELISNIKLDKVNDLQVTYNYNDAVPSMLVNKEYKLDQRDLTVSYGYDALGILNHIEAIDPNMAGTLYSETVTSRDSKNRISALTSQFNSNIYADSQGFGEIIQYDDFGQIDYWYLLDEPTNLIYNHMLHKQLYFYDNIGNIEQIADHINSSFSVSMDYSKNINAVSNPYGAKRLSQLNHSEGHDKFIYDVLGNTIERQKFDKNNPGNLIGKEKFIYNSAGLLRKFIKETDNTGNNKWIFTKKYSIFGGVESESMDDAPEQIELSYDYNLKGAGGETIARYHGVKIGNDQIALYPYEMLVGGGEISNRFDGSKSIAVTGFRGNVRLSAEIDAAGNAEYAYFNYTPFGEKLSTYTLSSQDLGFGNARKQMKSDYYQLGSRTYDPSMGRFLQQDPLYEAFPGYSSYSYGFNNPVKFGDPSGLAPEAHYKGGQIVLELDGTPSEFVRHGTYWSLIYRENGVMVGSKVLSPALVEAYGLNSVTEDTVPYSAVSSGSGVSGKKDPADLKIEEWSNEFSDKISNRSAYEYKPAEQTVVAGSADGFKADLGGGISSGSNVGKSVAFDYDAARARVFEFTQDWNKINKLEHMGDIINLFNYYLDNPSQEGEVYNGNFLFLKCLAHYQTGEGKDLMVDVQSIDLHGKVPLGIGKVGVQLFSLTDADLTAVGNFANLSDEGLALGTITVYKTANTMAILKDTYNFDVKIPEANFHTKFGVFLGQLFSGRNFGNSVSWLIHNYLIPVQYHRPPTGKFDIHFKGVYSR